METTAVKLSGVLINPIAPVSTASGKKYRQPGYMVTPVFSGVDRMTSCAWHVPTKELAERLWKALVAGKALTELCAKTDVNGKTFADFKLHFLGRTLNADLKRLGF